MCSNSMALRVVSSLLALAACSSSSADPALRLDGFSPSSADPGELLDVVGSFVAARAPSVDLRHPNDAPVVRTARVMLRAEFAADAGGMANAGVTPEYELQELALIEDGRLQGTVPRAAPAGPYHVVLVDALGRSTVSESVFVVNSVPGAVVMRSDTTLLRSGECSGPIHLEAEGVAAQSSVQVDLAVNDAAQIFATESCNEDPIDHLLLTPEQPTTVFYVRSDVPGTFQVVATPSGFPESSLSFEVAGPDALAVEIDQASIVGDCLRVSVERRTASSSNAVVADLPLTLRFEASADAPHAHAVTFGANECTSVPDPNSGGATIQAGEESATFWIQGTEPGYIDVVVSAPDHDEARAHVVFVERPAGVRFTESKVVEIPLHGPCVPVELWLVNKDAQPIFNPDSSGITFHVVLVRGDGGENGPASIPTDEACNPDVQLTSLDVATHRTVWFLPEVVGTVQWEAWLDMTNSTPVSVEVFQLVVRLPSAAQTTLVAGAPHSVELSLTKNGASWASPVDLPVKVWTSPSAGTPGAPQLYDDQMDLLPDDGTFVIKANNSAGSFFLSTDVAAELYVAASLDGTHVGGETYNVSPGAERRLRFANPPRVASTTRCDPERPIIVQLQDQFGNPVTADHDYSFSLTENGVPSSHLAADCSDSRAFGTTLLSGESEMRYVVLPPQAGIPTGALLMLTHDGSSVQQLLTFVDDCGNGHVDPQEDCDPSAVLDKPTPFASLTTLGCSGLCQPLFSEPFCVPETNLCFGSVDAIVSPSLSLESIVGLIEDGSVNGRFVIQVGDETSSSAAAAGGAIRWDMSPSILVVGGHFLSRGLELDQAGLEIRGGNILLAGLQLLGRQVGQGLRVRSGTLWLQNVDIEDVQGTALTVEDGATVYLKDVRIRGASAFGIVAEEDSHVYVDRSTVVSNGKGGLKIEGHYEITNTLIAKNGSVTLDGSIGGVSLGSLAQGVFEHNTVYANEARLVGSATQVAGVDCLATGTSVVSSIVRENAACRRLQCPASLSPIQNADLDPGCSSLRNNLYPSESTPVDAVATPPGLVEGIAGDASSLRLTCGSYNRGWSRQSTNISRLDLDRETRGASRDVGSDEALRCE